MTYSIANGFSDIEIIKLERRINKKRHEQEEKERKHLETSKARYDKKMLTAHNKKDIERMHNHKRRALKLLAFGNGLTAKQWAQTKEETGGRCVYCGQIKPLAIDHVEPLTKYGMHDIINIVPSCKSCNSKKHNKSLLIFLYTNCKGEKNDKENYRNTEDTEYEGKTKPAPTFAGTGNDELRTGTKKNAQT